MRRFLTLTLSILVAFSLADAKAGFVNGSFETGNLQGWQSSGAVSVETLGSSGIEPTQGSYEALLLNHPPGGTRASAH